MEGWKHCPRCRGEGVIWSDSGEDYEVCSRQPPSPLQDYEPYPDQGSAIVDDDRFVKAPVGNAYGQPYIRKVNDVWLFGVSCVLSFQEVVVSDEFAKAWMSQFQPSYNVQP